MLVLLGFATLALLAIGVYRGGQVVHVLASRALDLSERKIRVLEVHAQGPAIPKAIPPDLYRRITSWQDQEAQEAERKILLDLYQEFRDSPDPWVEVRAHLPKAPHDDDLPTEMFTQ